MNYKFLILILSLLFIISCSNEPKKVYTGKELYTKNCVACHGNDGKKGLATAADLSTSTISIKEQTTIITEGKSMMAAFKHSLTTSEIDSIVVYIQKLRE